MHFAKKQFVSVKGPFKYYVSKEVGGWDWPKNKKNISKVKEKYSSLLAHKKGHFTCLCPFGSGLRKFALDLVIVFFSAFLKKNTTTKSSANFLSSESSKLKLYEIYLYFQGKEYEEEAQCTVIKNIPHFNV